MMKDVVHKYKERFCQSSSQVNDQMLLKKQASTALILQPLNRKLYETQKIEKLRQQILEKQKKEGQVPKKVKIELEEEVITPEMTMNKRDLRQ